MVRAFKIVAAKKEEEIADDELERKPAKKVLN